MTHHLKQTEPQYTKGKLEAFPFQDGAISLVIGQDQIADMVNEYEGDLQHNNAQLICSSVNIIQSLADSLGVNAVELAKRMEEGKLINRMFRTLSGYHKRKPSIDAGAIIHDLQNPTIK